MKTYLLAEAIRASQAFLALAELELSRTSSPPLTRISPKLRELASQARDAIKEVK